MIAKDIAPKTGVLPFVIMDDLLTHARAELYAAEPDDFMRLRGELADAAKTAGQPGVAKQIAGLRKPTKAAWTLNQLSRAHPEAAGRLAGLAAELRGGGDGARLRELTRARNQLIDELTRQAFEAADVASPPAALREDVISTLGAAIADPEVAADLAEGTLVRAVQWAGFGLVPLTPASSAAPAAPSAAARSAAPAAPSAAAPSAAARSAAARSAAARSAAARKPSAATPEPDDELALRRQQKLLSAEQAAADATQSAASAAQAEEILEDTVRDLEDQLEQARQELAMARREAYRAESRRKRAIADLSRFRE
jgi:hypothetical protein